MNYDDYAPRIFDEHDDDRRGLDNEIMDEIPGLRFDAGLEQSNTSEILGGEVCEDDVIALLGAEQEAILRTVSRARDARRPCPPMCAVDLDAPLPEEADFLGAAASAYPLLSQLEAAWREAARPRIVRVDTEETYQAFRDGSSPERLLLLSRLADIEGRLAAHLSDPDAHSPDLAEEMDEAQALAAAEAQKQIPLSMPRHFDGLVEAWHDGDMAAASVVLPRADGGRYIATTAEPRKKGELEAAKAAAEAGVPAAAIVGYLPAIGATLAAADAIKALASGADDKPGTLLKRPEARAGRPFLVRLESQVHPATFALGELLCLCQAGNARACEEWARLAAEAPVPVREAMAEIQMALRAGAGPTSVGGAAWDRVSGWARGAGTYAKELWEKLLRLVRLAPASKPAALPAPAQQKALPKRASA